MERLTETCEFDNQKYVMLKKHRTWILRKEYDGNTDSENAIVRLAAYEDAEENGQLIVLPCKVGDYIFAPTRNFVSTFIVTSFWVTQNFVFINWNLQEGITGNFRIDCVPAHEIGKTVFLTREEAEAALTAMEGREDG